MVWGNPQTKLEKARAALLAPASWAYACASYLRLVSYASGRLPQTRLPVPVLSIGNLTCGGTGKTPIAIDLASRLLDRGYKVAVLSRGYKRRSSSRVTVVGDGQGNFADCAASGDEPFMMARALPDAVVISGADRRETAYMAITEFGCNLILLDDGFQHLQLRRDQDIVLIDYNDEPENDRVLPAGRLREPLSAIARANWVVVTKVPENPDLRKLERIKETVTRLAPRAQITECRFKPDRIINIGNGSNTYDPSYLNGMKVLAICGIARPGSFRQQLEKLGTRVTELMSFPDHHWYTARDRQSIFEAFEQSSADFIVTTAKDAVRMPADLTEKLPLCVLELKVDWLGPVAAIPAEASPRQKANISQ